MAEGYGQYSSDNYQGQHHGLNIEDQSEASWQGSYNPTEQQAPAWAPPPSSSYYGHGAPPVQPMYTSEPQFQQSKCVVNVLKSLGYLSSFLLNEDPQPYVMNPMNPPSADQFRESQEIDPGTMGQMSAGYSPYVGQEYSSDSFDEEQPLLKELGIDLELIRKKVI